MSQNVENKVVEFQFNNKDFEKNVATSMSTLDKLKSALNFDGALKGFDNLDRATKNFDLSSMDKSVETTGSKFSALEAIALGALMRIGQQAVDVDEVGIQAVQMHQVRFFPANHPNRPTGGKVTAAVHQPSKSAAQGLKLHVPVGGDFDSARLGPSSVSVENKGFHPPVLASALQGLHQPACAAGGIDCVNQNHFHGLPPEISPKRNIGEHMQNIGSGIGLLEEPKEKETGKHSRRYPCDLSKLCPGAVNHLWN